MSFIVRPGRCSGENRRGLILLSRRKEKITKETRRSGATTKSISPRRRRRRGERENKTCVTTKDTKEHRGGQGQHQNRKATQEEARTLTHDSDRADSALRDGIISAVGSVAGKEPHRFAAETVAGKEPRRSAAGSAGGTEPHRDMTRSTS
jgi:hypothetical protein